MRVRETGEGKGEEGSEGKVDKRGETQWMMRKRSEVRVMRSQGF